MSEKVNPVVELFVCTGADRHLLQGVLQTGHLHLFQTHPGEVRKDHYTVRLSSEQVETIIAKFGATKSGRARIQAWVDSSLVIPPIPPGE